MNKHTLLSQSGIIYKLTSPSQKSYIGQTITSLDERLKYHVIQNGCRAIANAIRKYGSDAFEVEVLRECPEACLNTWEQIEILRHQTLSPNGYNLTTGGSYGKHTEETKRRISKNSPGFRGKHTEETKRKISEKKTGKKRGPLSPEHRHNLSKSLKGRVHSPEVRRKISDGMKRYHKENRNEQ